MEIQTKPLLRTRTPRVKCILTHKNYPDVIVCLFTGELNVYDPKTMQLKKSVQVTSVPIRTGAIIPSKDWILLGTDEGTILTLDIGNFSVIDTMKAHDDFIRKIAVDEANCRIVTVSDDNRTKLWSYSDGLILIHRYKDSKHFVMDACFCPCDANQFLTASLDGKIRLYSVANTKCIRTYKGHEAGVNSLDFINSHMFVSGADDANVIVWDIKRILPVAVLKGHTNNVNKIRAIKNGFASCSEDSSVRFWSSDFRPIEVVSLQGRVWDIVVKGSKIFVGSDEELAIFQELKSDNNAVLCENRIFYNTKNTFFSVKFDEIGAFKELGTFEPEFTSFTVNGNGKLVAVFIDDDFTVYSTLGMRKKFADSGSSLLFFGPDSFLYLKDQSINVASRFEVESTFEVEGVTNLLWTDGEKIILNTDATCLYSTAGDLIHQFETLSGKAVMLGQNIVLFDERITIFDASYGQLTEYDLQVESFFVSGDILFASTTAKSFYIIISGGQAHINSIRHRTHLIGYREGILLYSQNGIKQEVLDEDFISYQRDFLKGDQPVPGENIRDKAIEFLESLEQHDKALELCTDDNQRFEILIKIGKLEEALKSANSPIKLDKLGRKFFDQKDMVNAAECFYKSNDINSLFLADIFGQKKYLRHVADMAKKSGQNNLAFFASYKNKEYEACRALLKDTPFYKAFSEFHC